MNPSDNNVFTLEWCSYQENNAHALGHAVESKKGVKQFNSIRPCASYVGVTYAKLMKHIR